MDSRADAGVVGRQRHPVKRNLGAYAHVQRCFSGSSALTRVEGRRHPGDRPWSYGWSLMWIGALLRRRDMSELDAWYVRIGREVHEDGGKPCDPTVAREPLGELGLSPTLLDEAMTDPTTHDDVRLDHQRCSTPAATASRRCTSPTVNACSDRGKPIEIPTMPSSE